MNAVLQEEVQSPVSSESSYEVWSSDGSTDLSESGEECSDEECREQVSPRRKRKCPVVP